MMRDRSKLVRRSVCHSQCNCLKEPKITVRMSRSSGKGSSSRRGHVYYTQSSEDESDRAHDDNVQICQLKRARSIRTILMDASAQGKIDYAEDALNPPFNLSSMRSLTRLQGRICSS